MRHALETLQFVEKASIRTDIVSKEASFTVKDPAQFDFAKVKGAIAKAGYEQVELIKSPQAAAKPPATAKGTAPAKSTGKAAK